MVRAVGHLVRVEPVPEAVPEGEATTARVAQTAADASAATATGVGVAQVAKTAADAAADLAMEDRA
jgi:hypothetical protein